MKKTIPLLLFLTILLVSSVSAYFPRHHVWTTIEAFRASNGGISQICEGRLEYIIAGNLANDAPVVHYYESDQIVSYIGTHIKQNYERCLQEAGSDLDLQCMCYGAASHLIQDHTSHYKLVPMNLERLWLSNNLLHPPIELGAEALLMNYVKGDRSLIPVLEKYQASNYAEVEALTERSYNLFRCGEVICPSDFNYITDSYKNKYVDFWKKFTNLRNIDKDMAIVGTSIAGEKFTNAVYNPQKVRLPFVYYFYSGIIFFIGIAIIVSTYIFGRNGWVWVNYIIGALITIISGLIFVSMLLGTSWLWFMSMQNVAAKFVDISEFDVFVSEDIEQTRFFYEQGFLKEDYREASGLTFYLGDIKVEGALNKAETKFTKIAFPLFFTILSLLIVVSFWRMRIPKK